jgi:hypothetical protein
MKYLEVPDDSGTKANGVLSNLTALLKTNLTDIQKHTIADA